MKKTYNKLDSELLLVETEGGFMGASVRLETSVTVQDYEVYGWEGATLADPTGASKVTTDDGAFNVTFD